MRRISLLAILFIVAGIVSLTPNAFGQIQIILKTDLSGIEGKEGILYTANIPVGVSGDKHYHPGYQFSYVLEGSIVMNLEGKPPATYKAGDGFYLPPGQVHFPSNSGTISAKIISFWIAEKGEPPNVPVK